MFQNIKKLFSKKPKSESISYMDQIIFFKDTALQDIEISIQPDGNNTVLVLRELKNNYRIIVDKETSLILSLIFNQYYKKENISALMNLFEKD